MKRFYKDVSFARTDLGWAVSLDGRPIKTQEGQPQVVPTEALAAKLAGEWEAQGETIDPTAFRYRDMTDYALDIVARDKDSVVEKLLGYAETDTLCYRADPEDALYRRQQEVWEPLVAGLEAREGLTLHRVSGIIHRPQNPQSLLSLRSRIEGFDAFRLTALEQATSLAASICVGLAAMEDSADPDALWDAANLEEDWQAELWGQDEEAQERREKRRQDFHAAIEFARAAAA